MQRVLRYMLVVSFMAFCILAVTAFWVKKKHLHLFEILAIWFVVIIIDSPGYTYFLTNKHWITISDNEKLAIIRILYTLIFNPLFIAWVLDETLKLKRFHFRLLSYLGVIIVLSLGGLALHLLEIVKFISTSGILSYPVFKTILLIMALLSVRFIRYLMRGDGVSNAEHT